MSCSTAAILPHQCSQDRWTVCTNASVVDTTVCCAVARIGLVKPDKAKGVENMVLQMAQRGQLNEKVSFLERCTILSHSEVIIGLQFTSRCRHGISDSTLVSRRSCEQ